MWSCCNCLSAALCPSPQSTCVSIGIDILVPTLTSMGELGWVLPFTSLDSLSSHSFLIPDRWGSISHNLLPRWSHFLGPASHISLFITFNSVHTDLFKRGWGGVSHPCWTSPSRVEVAELPPCCCASNMWLSMYSQNMYLLYSCLPLPQGNYREKVLLLRCVDSTPRLLPTAPSWTILFCWCFAYDLIISSSCYNKIPQSEWGKHQTLSLTDTEAGSQRSKCQRGWVLVRAPFLACQQPPSLCVLTWERELFLSSFL